MKALKILLYVILGLGALLLLLGIFGKKDYHIERSIDIDAPRDVVYNHVRFFKNFETWSPWASLDPQMTTTISGTDGEVGAMYQWSGNDKVGKGQQTITTMNPDRIEMQIKFEEPFESSSPTFMALKPDGKKTTVTWGFDMHVAFPWNGMAMFTDVDAGVGADYERGLKNLKKVCEEIAHKKYRNFEIAEAEIPLKYYIGMRKTVPVAEISAFFGTNLPKAMEQVQKNGATMAGAPSGLFWSYDEQAGKTDMAAAIPTAESKKYTGGLSVFEVGGKKALVIDYFGPYEKTGEAHYAMDDYMKEKGLQTIPPAIEEYITDPGKEPDTAKWLTKIIYFVEPKPAEAGAEK